jgi:glycosyltransferase involved in cell wall biosynthesis
MKIVIVTWANNSEKTIARTIKSVLSQSYQNFIYYIIDNASVDHTKDIIHDYASIDSRIVPIDKPQNDKWVFFKILPKILERCGVDDYICNIDADDEYQSDFFLKMLNFIQKNHLDIGICGSEGINSETNKIVGTRKLNTDMIIQQEGFNYYLQYYYQFMRTIWGKMFSASVLLKSNFLPNSQMSFYGIDTLFNIEAFTCSKRIGILSETLHKYYISRKSISYQFDIHRFQSDKVLFDRAAKFLADKCGYISKQNYYFLLSVYLYAIRDTINVLLDSQVNDKVKLVYLHRIFSDYRTKKINQITYPAVVCDRQKLYSQLTEWIYDKEIEPSIVNIANMADIFAVMGVYPTHVKNWETCYVFLLLINIRNQTKNEFQLNENENVIRLVTSKEKILSRLNVDFLSYFSEISFLVLQHKETNVLKKIEGIIESNQNIPVEYIDDFLHLGLDIAAELELSGDFIYLKKIRIKVLIDCSRISDAKAELDNWNELMPTDKDFQMFRKILDEPQQEK